MSRRYSLDFSYSSDGIYGIFICIGLLAVLLLFVMRIGYSDTGEYDGDRNSCKIRFMQKERVFMEPLAP